MTDFEKSPIQPAEGSGRHPIQWPGGQRPKSAERGSIAGRRDVNSDLERLEDSA